MVHRREECIDLDYPLIKKRKREDIENQIQRGILKVPTVRLEFKEFNHNFAEDLKHAPALADQDPHVSERKNLPAPWKRIRKRPSQYKNDASSLVDDIDY